MVRSPDPVLAAPQFLSLMLASGGDRRIAISAGANTNMYGASPFPRAVLGYASSTANDISLAAFAHLEALVAGQPAGKLGDPATYRAMLDALRARLRAVWQLDGATRIVFAASGTDLEYVALGLTRARFGKPVTNILLGADEIGSGCVLSAAGRYFAQESAVSPITPKGEVVAGLDDTLIVNLPVRDETGAPVASREIAAQIDAVVREARRQGRHVLCHVVHGSKTGLVLPAGADLDQLARRHAGSLTFVVDACQARIEPEAIRAYLDRQAVVLLTGSKFVGGAPFSGIALVPEPLAPTRALAAGMATIFRRGEWPADWQGCSHLPETANPGLLLRLAGAAFELERFAAVRREARERGILRFGQTVRALADRLGVALIGPGLDGDGLHRTTLATLDLSRLPGTPDFALAQRWHRVLAARGVRLGQPVKCVRHPAGGFAATLRISLSMPLIVELAALDDSALGARLDRDMDRVADVLEAAQRSLAS